MTELWCSREPGLWEQALDRYWDSVKPQNLELERRMEALDLERIKRMDAEQWYDFLHNEYFCWKYTAANRYATTTSCLERYREKDELGELLRVKERLLAIDPDDVLRDLNAAREIDGLGTAGASGLLAVMYPDWFGTVDQFVVKALRQVRILPEGEALAEMNPDDIKPEEGVLLIGIMRRKAAKNNERFATETWTPRKIDKLLWTYRQEHGGC